MKPHATDRAELEPPRLRIGHLIASNFAGGPEKQILTLSQRLRDAGWFVTIGSFLENRSDVEILQHARDRDLQTFLIDTKSPFDPTAILQLRRHLKAESIDVLVTHGYKANVVGRVATLLGPTRPIATVRGYTAANWKIRAYEVLDRWVLRTMPMVFTVSEGTLHVLRGHGLSGPKYRVLHNAVDCRLDPAPLDLRLEYGLPSDAFVMVAAGRFSPEKGHRYLVDAMAQICEEHPRAHCILFGEGSLSSDLRSQVERLGLKQKVLLPGFRKDVLRCLKASDLVVNPSLSEGLPNVVLEAMSQSRAVVATDVGGVSELIEDGATGWLVKAGDVDSLAEAIRHALENDARRTEVGERARQKALDEFSFEQQAVRFRSLTLKLLER